ncbi:MAG: hypothetical protein IKB34_09085 [Clostridia bacterium]|nr:hypothetical protein [Clostridia bacterium]
MAENKLADMSTEFAVKILSVTDGIKGHYSLANQVEIRLGFFQLNPSLRTG